MHVAPLGVHRALLDPGHLMTLAVDPSITRRMPIRSRNGDASTLVTCACSGAPGVNDGARIDFSKVSNSGSRSCESGISPLPGLVSNARPARDLAAEVGVPRGCRRC
jgi:hypothetical protein